MYLAPLLVILPLFPAGPQAAVAAPGAPRGLDNESALRVSRAVQGRIALVELVERVAGKDVFLRSAQGVVIGPKHLMTIAPWLAGEIEAAPSPAPGRSLFILVEEGSGRRRLPAQVIQSDAQTGLIVLHSPDLRGAALTFNPLPLLSKDTPVLLVQPTAEGRPTIRTGRILQGRAHLDQGRGTNPLLLFDLDEPRLGGSVYSPWEDHLAGLSGAFLTDLSGGFLGIVTPPALEAAQQSSATGKPPGKKGAARPDPKSKLKEGEVLALPAEIARLLSETLSRGKTPLRGYFGASFREVHDPPEEARRLGSARRGVRVEKVYPGGPADQGGLRQGDWLVAIAEKKGVSYGEVVHFSELVEYTGHGKVVHLQVARPGENGLQLIRLQIRIGTR